MISLQPANFVWRVAKNGHHWISADAPDSDDGERFLSDLIPFHTAGYRPTFPLRDHTGLFREFAATPRDETSIQAFADRHGMLGGVELKFITVGERIEGAGSPVGAGEPDSVWKREIGDMQSCVELYEAARKNDLTKLERHIHWSDESVSYRSDPDWRPADGVPEGETMSFSKILMKSSDPERWQRLRAEDLVTPALWYLQSQINKRISEKTSPLLLWDNDTEALVNRIMPKNLLGAMWLQFALSVERKSEFRQCSHCGKWFQLSPGMARSDKQFCSTACRVKAFRQRRLELTTHDEPPAKSGATTLGAQSAKKKPSRRASKKKR